MATNEETLYENMKKEVKEPQVNHPLPEQVDALKTEVKKKDNLEKRLMALGGAIIAGGATGAALAAILGHDAKSDEEEVFQIIDEDDDKSFDEAFQDAREQLGAGAAFRWHGGVYSTFTEEEWNNMSPEEREAYNQKVEPLMTDEDHNANNYQHHAAPTTHQEPERPAQPTKPEPPTPQNNDEIKIEEEEVTELNGQKVIVASGTHNGKPMVLIDVDRDGTYDLMVEDQNNDGNISENEYVDISDRHIAVHMQIPDSPGPHPINDEWTIIEEGETELDGHRVIVARADHNGERAVLFDVDHDGHYDVALEDSNHDGQITEDDYHNISSQGLTVQDQSLVTSGGGHPIHEEDPVVEIDYTTEARVQIDEEGHEAIGAVGTVDGKPAIVVDINRDGTYDRAVVESGNGEKDVVNIASADARVHDMSLVDNQYSQASLEHQDDTTSDYTHTLASEEKETTETDMKDLAENTSGEDSSEESGEDSPYETEDNDDAVANHYNEMAFGEDSMADTGDGMMDYGLDA